MSLRTEATEQYIKAQKRGRKLQKELSHRGLDPYLQVLDNLLDPGTVTGEVELGVQEIPMDRIVGTKTEGRKNAFAANFMPLLADDTEFSAKWRRLCEAHLGSEGIRDPIRCYEYLGNYYVQEGNKRVSVLKSYDAAAISGYVTRLLPRHNGDEAVERYYEYLDYYPLTRLNQIYFSRKGSFPKLQAALGHTPEQHWTEQERRSFLTLYYRLRGLFRRLGGEHLDVTEADALLVLLRIHSYDEITAMDEDTLFRHLQAVWNDVRALSIPISVSTEAQSNQEPAYWKNLVTTMFPHYLNVAFIHELTPENSNWVRAHEMGRLHMLEVLGERVETQVFSGVGKGEGAVEAMEQAIENGAEVIFTTTAPLVDACRRIAVKYPHVKIHNCSISMPYTGVRTYYSRIYEGKFISGAIAGAMCSGDRIGDRIGYIASYPIFGVPAGINAFALGAQLTNPRARVELKWSCVPGDPLKELMEQGVEVVSTLDIPLPGWEKGTWGTFRISPDGSTKMLASPYWDWGIFYVKLIRSIMDGSWEHLNSSRSGEQAVNYWWGLGSGVIGVELTDAIPEGVRILAKLLKHDIIEGDIYPFHRRIISQDGTVRNPGSRYFSPHEILHMDWLCDNVDGKIPTYEELSPRSQGFVRLQGIYRDQIPLDEQSVLL